MHLKSVVSALVVTVAGWLASVSPSVAGLVNEIYGTLNPYDAGLEPYRPNTVEYGDLAKGYTLRFTVNHEATYISGSGSPRYRQAFTNASLEDSAGRIYSFDHSDWVQYGAFSGPLYYIEFSNRNSPEPVFVSHFTFYYLDYSEPGTFGDFDFLDRIGDNVAAGVGFGSGLIIDTGYTVVEGWYVTGGPVTGGRTVEPVPTPGPISLVTVGLAMLLVYRRLNTSRNGF